MLLYCILEKFALNKLYNKYIHVCFGLKLWFSKRKFKVSTICLVLVLNFDFHGLHYNFQWENSKFKTKTSVNVFIIQFIQSEPFQYTMWKHLLHINTFFEDWMSQNSLNKLKILKHHFMSR